MFNRRRILAAALTVALFTVLAFGQEPAVPTLMRHVTDLTGTLSAQQVAMLDAKLRSFEDSTSNQIVVLMIPTLGSASLEDFTMRVAEANRIGVKGRDNGALLFIAKDDRRVRIEVGYGLEGALPDITSGQIIRNELGPHFRNGEYYEGIDAAVDAMMAATRGEYKAEKKKKEDSPLGIMPLFIILLIVFMIIRNSFGGPRGMLGGRRSSWGGGPFFGGGGFGGGGFGGGGFGGGGGFSGGGGSFGGGGASGRW
jgi:uncharacterized protein